MKTGKKPTYISLFSSAAPTVSVLRRRTRKRGFAVSLFPRFFLKANCKNIRISSPFCFGRGYAALFFFIPGGADNVQ